MFKALVDDQQLSKTQKMTYLKASVKGTAEKAIAGMFFESAMYDKAIEEECSVTECRLCHVHCWVDVSMK